MSPLHHGDEEPPPLLGTWGRLYALVLAWLVVMIGLLYLLTVSAR